MITFFVPENFKLSYYANLVTDDIIGCARTVVWHKIKNISANNDAMLLKLGRDVATYKIYQVVQILMLLWQHARFQSAVSSKFNITICGCTGHKIRLKMLKKQPNEGGTRICLRKDQVFCLIKLLATKRIIKTNYFVDCWCVEWHFWRDYQVVFS